MNVWDWIDDFYDEAYRNDDDERMRLPVVHAEGYDHRETDPKRALELFREGSRLAYRLNESWWKIFFDDWCVSAWLFFLRDFTTVLDLAVQNSLELRKPVYEQFPMRLSVHRNLVHAYVGIDPAGYADNILQSLKHLEEVTPEGSEDQYLILGTRREHALETENLSLAQEMVAQSLQLADRDEDPGSACHYSTFSYSGLCEIAWREQKWDVLRDAAVAGDSNARESDLKMELIEFLLWQAVVARHAGKEPEASSLYRQAHHRLRRLQMPPDRAFYDALCGYHVLGHDLHQALQAREKELATVGGTGRFAYEARCHLRVCHLRSQLNQLQSSDVQAAEDAIRKLKQPEDRLRELHAL